MTVRVIYSYAESARGGGKRKGGGGNSLKLETQPVSFHIYLLMIDNR